MVTPEENAFLAKKYGYDPTKFQANDDTGTIEPIHAEAPTTSVATINPLKEQDQQIGKLTSAGYGAAAAIPSVVGGAAGAGLTSALTTGLRAAPHPLAKLAGYVAPIIGALAAGAGAQSVAQPLYPDWYKKKIADSLNTNPLSFAAGSLAAQLPVMTISPAALRSAGAGARTLLTEGEIGANQAANLANVGVGAAIPASTALYHGLKGEHIDPLTTAMEIAAGGAMSSPTKLAQRVFGFHPTSGDSPLQERSSALLNEPIDKVQQAADVLNKTTSEPPYIPEGVRPPTAENIPANGTVRLYSGGTQLGYDFSPYQNYAEGYAAKAGPEGKVWYVDVPEGHPALKKAFEEFKGGPKAPYINTKLGDTERANAKLMQFNNPQKQIITPASTDMTEQAADSALAKNLSELESQIADKNIPITEDKNAPRLQEETPAPVRKVPPAIEQYFTRLGQEVRDVKVEGTDTRFDVVNPTTGEKQTVYGSALVNQRKAKISRERSDTWPHELMEQYVHDLETSPNPRDVAFIEDMKAKVAATPEYQKANSEGKSYAKDPREYLVQGTGERAISQINTGDYSFGKDLAAHLKARYSGGDMESITRLMANKLRFGKPSGEFRAPDMKAPSEEQRAQPVEKRTPKGDIRPILKVGENYYEGKTHADAMRSAPIEDRAAAIQAFNDDATHLFRDEAGQDFSRREVGGVHSQDLAEYNARRKDLAKLKESVAQTPPAVETPAERPTVAERRAVESNRPMEKAIEARNQKAKDLPEEYAASRHEENARVKMIMDNLRTLKAEGYPEDINNLLQRNQPYLKTLSVNEQKYIANQARKAINHIKHELSDSEFKSAENSYDYSVDDKEHIANGLYNGDSVTLTHDYKKFTSGDRLKVADNPNVHVYDQVMPGESAVESERQLELNHGNESVTLHSARNIAVTDGKSTESIPLQLLKPLVAKASENEANANMRRYQPATADLPPEEDMRDTSKQGFLEFMAPVYDKVRKVSTHLSEAFKNTEAERDRLLGKYLNEPIVELTKLDPKDVKRANDRRIEIESEGKSGIELTAAQKHADSVLERISAIKDEANAIGLKPDWINPQTGEHIDNTFDSRTDTYTPSRSMMNRESMRVLRKAPNSPEGQAIRNSWIEHLVEGMTKDKVENPRAAATAKVQGFLKQLNSRTGMTSAEFNALRKHKSYGLPEDLQEKDPIDAWMRYAKRASADIAVFKHLESDPSIAPKLGLGEEGNPGGPQDLSGDPVVQQALQSLYRKYFSSPDDTVHKASRLLGSVIMGPKTGIINAANAVVSATPYLGKASDLLAFPRALFNLGEASRASLRTNARQPNAVGQIILDPETSQGWSDTLGRILRYPREKLEQASRIFTFAVGKELARSGDPAFLDKFGRGAEPGDLDVIAKNFVKRVEGTYSGEGLPTGINEGPLAPFLQLSKWSVEKSNIIWQDVVKPAQTGNYKPLLAYTLAGIIGGEGITQLNEFLNQRKRQSATPAELAALPKSDAIVNSIVTAMQAAGYAGIVMDVAKMGSDMFTFGQTSRGINFPLQQFVTETIGENLVDAKAAIDNGDDPTEVIVALAKKMSLDTVQAARMVANFASSDRAKEGERQDKFRDLRVFKTLSGEQVPKYDAGVNNPFINADEKKFKRTNSVEEAMSLLPKMIEKYAKEPETLMKKLAALKQNSYQTMPSIDKDTQEFAKYYAFLEQVLGPKAAAVRMEDYVAQTGLNKAKAEMVP